MPVVLQCGHGVLKVAFAQSTPGERNFRGCYFLLLLPLSNLHSWVPTMVRATLNSFQKAISGEICFHFPLEKLNMFCHLRPQERYCVIHTFRECQLPRERPLATAGNRAQQGQCLPFFPF